MVTRFIFSAAFFLVCSSCSLLDYGSLDNAYGAGKTGQSADGGSSDGSTSSEGGGPKTISIVGNTSAGPQNDDKITVAIPTAAVAGDVVWIIVGTQNSAYVQGPGFEINDAQSGSCGGYRATFLDKALSDADITAGSFTFALTTKDGGTMTDGVAAILTAFHNANLVPGDKIFGNVDGNTTGLLTVPAITVSAPSEVQWLAMQTTYDSGNWVAPSDMTLGGETSFAATFTSTNITSGSTGPQAVQATVENGDCAGFAFVSLTVAK